MKILNIRNIISSIIYSAVLCLLVLPTGIRLYPILSLSSNMSLLNIYWLILLIASPILLIINIFISWGTKYFRTWGKVFGLYLFLDLSIFISNKFSAIGARGDLYIMIPDLIIRIIAMCICGFCVYKLAKYMLPNQNQRELMYIVSAFALTQIIILCTSALLTYPLIGK